MSKNTDESHTGPHPSPRPHVNLDILMTSLRVRLEALRPKNENEFYSQVDKTDPPTGADLTNLILLELLQKQGEQPQ